MKSSVTELTEQDLAEIARTVQQVVPRGTERKTAYAVADTASYLKLCTYLTETTSARVPTEYCVFFSIEEAKRWLRSTR